MQNFTLYLPYHLFCASTITMGLKGTQEICIIWSHSCIFHFHLDNSCILSLFCLQLQYPCLITTMHRSLSSSAVVPLESHPGGKSPSDWSLILILLLWLDRSSLTNPLSFCFSNLNTNIPYKILDQETQEKGDVSYRNIYLTGKLTTSLECNLKCYFCLLPNMDMLKRIQNSLKF